MSRSGDRLRYLLLSDEGFVTEFDRQWVAVAGEQIVSANPELGVVLNRLRDQPQDYESKPVIAFVVKGVLQ
tara:strand:+ start:435 stop:647 length:213 start_codon:yes stop_codon:yes gene_type:complete